MSFPIAFKGRLGADPDVTFAGNGTAIAKMRIVTNGRRLVDGNWEDTDTSWWTVTAFGRTAEAIADHADMHKGALVVVIGKIKQRDWEKDGVKRTTAEVTADEVAVLVKPGAAKPAAAQDQGWPEAAPF